MRRELESAAKAGSLDGAGELVARIEDELARVTGELERIRAGDGRVSDGASVLVVDDDPVTRQMLPDARGTGTPRDDGGRRPAGAGSRAFRAVRRGAAGRPDAIPGRHEVLEQLKGDELRHIPVVMVTSVDEVESAVRCIELGADDYLSKPIDPVLLSPGSTPA